MRSVPFSYITKADLFHERCIHVHSLFGLLEHLEDHGIDRCVLEAALAGLAQGRAEGERDDHIVGMFFEATTASARVDVEILEARTRLTFDRRLLERLRYAMQCSADVALPCWKMLVVYGKWMAVKM